MEHPSKKNHPAGTRFLACRNTTTLFEYIVLEWSPSGRRLKVSELHGDQRTEWWMDASHYDVKEILCTADEKRAALVRKFIDEYL